MKKQRRYKKKRKFARLNINVYDKKVTEHVLERITERMIMSQNIKLNKKQKEKLYSKALNIVKDAVTNYFAIYRSKEVTIIYANLKENYDCGKYIISNDKTIKTFYYTNFLDEINKYDIKFRNKNLESIIMHKDSINNLLICKIDDNNKVNFTIDANSKKILSLNFGEGEYNVNN